MEARFTAPVQTGPGARPASCTMGTGSFPGVKSGRGVTLTPHPLLVPWSRKGRAIPLLLLRAVQPVQSLSACTMVHFKGKVDSRKGHESPEVEKWYSYTLSLTSALDGVGGQRQAPAALPRERPGTHCIGGWVGPRAGLDGCGKSRPPPGFDPRTVQPVASRYTD